MPANSKSTDMISSRLRYRVIEGLGLWGDLDRLFFVSLSKAGAMRNIPILCSHRRRRIRGSFSWIDHRLIRQGHLEGLSCPEFALYAFLVLVGNADGVSFYRQEKICHFLGEMDWGIFQTAREGLILADLIAFRPFHSGTPNGFYQVLSLDDVDDHASFGSKDD